MAVDYTTQAAGGIGDAVLRKEDRKFVTGEGRYVDDLKLPAMLHAAFVRSPFGHARITSIDAAAALAHARVSRWLADRAYARRRAARPGAHQAHADDVARVGAIHAGARRARHRCR